MKKATPRLGKKGKRLDEDIDNLNPTTNHPTVIMPLIISQLRELYRSAHYLRPGVIAPLPEDVERRWEE